jgi:site-specific DNA recombinase
MRKVPQTGPRIAAIYVRVSSPGQARRKGDGDPGDEIRERAGSAGEFDPTSLDTQEERCLAWAAENGYTVPSHLIFREIHTGFELRQRKKLSALREAAQNREMHAIVSYAVDRLSRNQAHLYILADEVENLGISLRFVTEDFEDSAVGRFIRSAKAFAGEIEREKLIERTQRGKRTRVESGKPLHGCRPLYGYVWDAGHKVYVVNEETATVVRRIFREAAAGRRLRQIAADLTAERVPTAGGKSHIWYPSTITDMLSNPAYKGQAVAYRWRTTKEGGQKFYLKRDPSEYITLPPTAIPPIVDAALYDSIQPRMRRNQAEAARGGRHPELFLLRAGVAKCGNCGTSLRCQVLYRRGVEHRYYYCCANAVSPGRCAKSGGHNARKLDAAVWAKVESILTRPEIVAAELEKLRGDDPTTDDLDAVERALADVSKRQGNLARAIAAVDDEDASAPLVAEVSALAERKRQLAAERDAILARQGQWAVAQAKMDDIRAWCRTVARNLGTLTYQERRTALLALGVKAVVWPRGAERRYEIVASIPLDFATASETTNDWR